MYDISAEVRGKEVAVLVWMRAAELGF